MASKALRRLLLLGTALVLVAGVTAADASGISPQDVAGEAIEQHVVVVPMTILPWNESLPFPQFDPAKGRLLDVTLTLEAQYEGELGLENVSTTSEATGTFVVNQDIEAHVQHDSTEVDLVYSGSFALDLFDGVIDFGGPSGVTEAMPAAGTSESVFADPTSLFCHYTGEGSITMQISAFRDFPQIAGGGDLSVHFSAAASAEVTVTYRYAPVSDGVPAPIKGTSGDDVLTGTSGDDVILGLGGNDVIDGGDGNDLISGGDGNDRLKGNLGDDVLCGADGKDRAVYLGAPAGVTVNLDDGTATGGHGSDGLHRIEHVTGTGSSDKLIGNGTMNRLDGFGGNDILKGRAGPDILNGGNGADILNGGNGPGTPNGIHILNGGNGNDVVDYRWAWYGVTVDLDMGTGRGTLDQLDSIERIWGSPHDDHLIGSAGDNAINGFAGNDTLEGGGGNDTLYGGLGIDSADGGIGIDTCFAETTSNC